MIRFIYNGRELTRDGQSLAAYNVADESVIHCLVRQGDPHPHPASVPPGGVAFDMGSLVFPLFGLILALIWYVGFCGWLWIKRNTFVLGFPIFRRGMAGIGKTLVWLLEFYVLATSMVISGESAR